MKGIGIFYRWGLPCLVSLAGIGLMLATFPRVDLPSSYDFSGKEAATGFINSVDSAKMEVLTICDLEMIFLPTPLNLQVNVPLKMELDAFENMNNFSDLSSAAYSDNILNKKSSNTEKANNLYHSTIRELMPYYKMQDNQNFSQKKDYVKLSIMEVKSGEKIISENLKLKNSDDMSKFVVPIEIFMSVSPDLTVNIVDNINEATLDKENIQQIREAIGSAKIFQKINTGYYKIVISL